jgi:uncharacterized paraquat-inducible protein A
MMPTQATPITLICPRLSCRAVLQVPALARGQRVRCAECGMTLMVPATSRQRPRAQPTQVGAEKNPASPSAAG